MATILDAFYISFGLKTEEMHKGAEDAEKVYADLVKKAKQHYKETIAAAKGKGAEEVAAARESAKEIQAAEMKAAAAIRKNLIKEAKETTEKLKEQTERGKEFFKGLIESGAEFFGLMALGVGMVEFAKGTLEAEVNAGRLAKTLDVDVESLEAMEGAAKMVGGSAEGMDQSLKGLNERLQLIAIHGPRSAMALKVFAGLGISEAALKGKDAIGVMGQLADKMQGMSEAKAMALGERLGLDEGTIRLLVKGKEGMAQLVEEQKKLGVASAEDAERAERMEQSMNKLKTIGGTLGRELMAFLMPALEAIGAGLLKLAAWAKEHPAAIKAALLGIGGAFLALKAQAIAAGIAAFGAWIKAQAGALIAGAQFLITGAQAAIAWVMATGGLSLLIPLIMLAVGGLIAMTGRIKEVGRWFNDLALDVVYHMLVAFFKVEHAAKHLWQEFKAAAMAPLEWVWNKLKAIIDLIQQPGHFLNSLFHGDIKGAVGSVKSAVGDVGAVTGLTPAYAGASAGMAMRPSISSQSSSMVHRTSNTSIGQITVQTQATDANGIAKDIRGAVRSHGLIDQADSGM
jgi:hypothetical protein